jgi:hypothetical protein
MQQFRQASIDDLILDLRYNSGGFLHIAQQLGSMVGGQNLQNQVFTSLLHNDKLSRDNFNYFFTRSDRKGTLLPLLSLKRVFVLTSNQTCSASEAIINALSPFIEVIRVGGTTCGKPYAFKQTNNCATAYFAIRTQGVNSLGQSVPTAGYAPHCAAYDNLNYSLGDVREAMLDTALHYQQMGVCPLSSLTQSTKMVKSGAVKEIYRALWRSNMIIK